MTPEQLKPIIEAALLAAGRPLDMEQLCGLFVTQGAEEDIAEAERQAVRKPIRQVLKDLTASYAADPMRGVELMEVASGFRFQVKPAHAKQVKALWASRPSRYSRALLETLALIAYRQPITRGEIEKVRGVSVSTQIVKNLLEYGWVRIVGHRNSPGRPMLYGTTRAFLDHFSLQSLEHLPPLAELQDLAKNDAALLKESADLDLLSLHGEGLTHVAEAAHEVAGHEADLDEVAEELAEAAEHAQQAEAEKDDNGGDELGARREPEKQEGPAPDAQQPEEDAL